MKPSEKSQAKHSDSINHLMTEYHKSHINRTNQLIHYVCVPLIFWSISALLWLVKIPVVINLALVVMTLLMLYYLLKSVKVFACMLVFSALCLGINFWLEAQALPLLWIAVVVFVLAWIGQFIGHHIEGKKPSFLQDLQFLLIGPAWVVFKFFKIKL
ncbi:DUF962 domain-containing protein [Marinicella litoralis]|uniref:Putative membrane protein YGL010W n=1 Tax=Marinicella litoralis TaxID=644220 RepID=A0A4R6XT94_9GAMM|nr:Mpo1-like protein [Marinicella litoralis]TDR19588.1 putative membrane protein YGL010W [Marinicella litoralis]